MSIRKRRSSGVSLIEILVTLVIMALGLLGVAGLQLLNLRNNQNAYHRTQASLLAADMFDRIRVNRGHAASYAVATGATTAGAGVAADDIASWKALLASELPDGDGSVAIDGRIATIRIEWNDRRVGTADGCSSSEARPACFETQGGL